MKRGGRCWDNAVIESFFSSLKTQRTDHKQNLTRDQARADVFDYIEPLLQSEKEAFYAELYQPIEFEKQAIVA